MSTETFVEQLYKRFLFRDSDAAGKSYWVNIIDSGEKTAAEVTHSFAQSEEFSGRASSVSQLYFLLFDRVPDSAGMQFWLDKLDEGMTFDGLTESFMASQEYENAYGNVADDSTFIEQLSQKGLNRSATDTEKAAYAASSRMEIIRSIAASNDFSKINGRNIETTSLYYGVLQRAPTEDELSENAYRYNSSYLVDKLYQNSDYQGEATPEALSIGFAHYNVTVEEGTGAIQITVHRSGRTDGESSVNYTIANPSSHLSSDGSPIEGTVHFGIGETDKTIQLEIINNNVPEMSSVTDITLTNASGAKLSLSDSFRVIVTDDDNQGAYNIESHAQKEGVVFKGQAADEKLGFDVEGLGDVNGDGLSDFLIRGTDKSYLIFGSSNLADTASKLSELDGNNGVQILGGHTSVADAGDVNGDGFKDIIFGNASANDTGQAYVVFGRGDSWQPSITLTSLRAGEGALINGITPGDDTGYAVAGAGDINNDGVDDLIVSSPGALLNESKTRGFGQSHIIFGRTDGWNGNLELSNFSRSDGAAIVGTMTGYANRFGTSANGVGDVNGDGIDDILIVNGDHGLFDRYHNGVSGYLIYGDKDGWDTPYFLDNLKDEDGARIFIHATRSKTLVEPIGDFNGDGRPDFMVSNTDNQWSDGGASIIYGRESNFQNGETVPEMRDKGLAFTLSFTNGRAHYSDIASVGDLNGDGFSDVLVGEGHFTDGLDVKSSAHLVYGSAGPREILQYLPDYSLTVGSSLVLEAANGADGVGSSMSGIGDVNGDGFGDFIIGAPGYDNGDMSDSGQVYLIFGNDQLFA